MYFCGFLLYSSISAWDKSILLWRGFFFVFFFSPPSCSYVYHNMVSSSQGKCLHYTDSQKIYHLIWHINFSEKQKYTELYKTEKWKGPSWEAWCVLTQLTQVDCSSNWRLQEKHNGHGLLLSTLLNCHQIWPHPRKKTFCQKYSINDSCLISCQESYHLSKQV